MVDSSLYNSVLILHINNPPVNALSSKVASQLWQHIHKAVSAENSIIGIVITGKGNFFSAGADISEFQTVNFLENPSLSYLTAEIDECPLPVIAAINGICYGGGFELALSCHYRVASPQAKFGFPEVQLGLIPGFAGAQLLSRVSCISVAIEIAVFGKIMNTKESLKNRIIDEIDLKDNLVIKCASSLMSNGNLYTRRSSNIPISDLSNLVPLLADAENRCHKTRHKQIAPLKCLNLIKKGVRMSYRKSLELSLDCFTEIVSSPQALAMQYSFFNNRKVFKWKVPGKGDYTMVNEATMKPITRIGVIGLGIMGTSIVTLFLSYGYEVMCHEIDKNKLNEGLSIIKGQISSIKAKYIPTNLQPTLKLNDLRNCDMIVEVIPENIELKQKLFQELSNICQPSTILCSNTSTLDIDKLFEFANQPERGIGMHFFNPAFSCPLIEIIPGKATNLATISRVMHETKRMDHVGVVVGNSNGFVGNRMFGVYLYESYNTVMDIGGRFDLVDLAVKDFGYPIGPFETLDLITFEVAILVNEDSILKFRPEFKKYDKLTFLLKKFINEGCLGRKNNKGFYLYGTYPKKINPIAKRLFIDFEDNKALLTLEEIAERSLLPLINEGFNILSDGVAFQSNDIDAVFVNGYGWPVWLGGPMYYAENVLGLPRMLEKIKTYQKKFPENPAWRPAPLLISRVQQIETAGVDSKL